ncbi:MAG: hypothetical protein VYE73_05405 [Acidobacteriota bacterium]|nr:hypothetical protein [Acidobacteriota bacterium]
MKRVPWAYIVPGFAILIGVFAPLIVGWRTLFLRDLMNFHFTVKQFQASAMADGFLPLVDPLRAGGQALVGNLNNVALYPDNILYLFAPPLWALSAHMWIHAFLAPVACYWMARAWGVSRRGSWVAGFIFATSGFFLSQLNLYNMVAGTALAPAFVAACLVLARGARPGLGIAAVGGFWALILLAGEPFVAMVVGATGVSAFLVRRPARTEWVRLVGAVACGTLVALPQIVELIRILPGSYRSVVGYLSATRLAGSFDPRWAIDWFVPLVFGEPGLGYWGDRLVGGFGALFYSTYPGMLALALLLAVGRPRSAQAWWGWGAIAVGVFVGLGGWNPAMFLLLQLPAASALRYCVKFFLLVVLGGALLAGLAYDRCVLGPDRLRLRWILVGIGVAALVGAVGLTVFSDTVAAALGGILTRDFALAEIVRWRASLVISAVLVAAYTLLLARVDRWRGAAASMLALHVASQWLILGSLAPMDEVAAYRGPPPAAAHVRPGERVFQACATGFACGDTNTAVLPDSSPKWVQRRGYEHLFPFAGVGSGIHYAFNSSPDGLDSFLTTATRFALEDLDDVELVRVLAASSVDLLLMGEAVDAEAAATVNLRAELETLAGRLWIYEIPQAAEETRMVGRVRSGKLDVVLKVLTSADFDPRSEVFLPGRPAGRTHGGAGTVTETRRGRESWSYDVESPDGGLLVWARSHLPIYDVHVDGVASKALLVNFGQMAVEVAAGRHVVDLEVDRGPFQRSLLGSLAGIAGLAALSFAASRRGGAVDPRLNAGPDRSGSGESAP